MATNVVRRIKSFIGCSIIISLTFWMEKGGTYIFRVFHIICEYNEL